jgi:hypothetical protein
MCQKYAAAAAARTRCKRTPWSGGGGTRSVEDALRNNRLGCHAWFLSITLGSFRLLHMEIGSASASASVYWTSSKRITRIMTLPVHVMAISDSLPQAEDPVSTTMDKAPAEVRKDSLPQPIQYKTNSRFLCWMLVLCLILHWILMKHWQIDVCATRESFALWATSRSVYAVLLQIWASQRLWVLENARKMVVKPNGRVLCQNTFFL